MEVEEATTAENSFRGEASSIHSESDSDEDASSDDGDESDVASERPVIDAEKARKKLYHVAKQLRATAKKTKTFEVQKLVKKLKGLRKKESSAEQAELAEKELAALKSIDINLLAGRALITKMVKAKLLPRPADVDDADEDEFLYLQMVRDEELLGETVLVENVADDGDRAVERAKAKVTSSKVLADEVGRFVEELKKLAGVEPKKEAEANVKGKGKASLDAEDADEEEREWSGSEEEFDSDDDAPRRLRLVDDDDKEGDGEDEDEEELMRIGKEKLKALGDLSQWDDMIGSDSGVESGSDDDDDDDDDDDNVTSKRQRRTQSASDASDNLSTSDSDDSDRSEDSASDSDSESDADSESDSDSDSEASSTAAPSRKRKASPSTSKSTKKSKSSSSTFLPSLSTGFIAGRSDDEWSDAEADLADRDLSELKSGSKKERKNRMGQRARKALYEKKYGSNANHIKMREKKKSLRSERAPTNTASSGGRQRPPAFQAPTKRDGGWGGAVAPLPKQPKRPFVPRPPPTVAPVQQNGTDKKSVPPPAAAANKSQEMHPSWIAKQKQKELMAQVKPQGKKVVFD
ncbi:bud site selection-related protein [Pseudozyma hubeiensis SY62]|uniref:Bud site selection-related protein n=1 Tax=Pseudozyma hubeiensis (strain SY62) TaxID=1305764 RepID=R9P4M2_PSEHS|nr:bud site selection-related protein [Pseudozyma hubeiensis SY62]GAC96254.1 bud site selection-related protein [Pseudozyma hubeiensis SY62]